MHGKELHKNDNIILFYTYEMGRTRIYKTPEEAYAAKLKNAREKYREKTKDNERKKWGFINMVITPDMVGKTVKELELEYKGARKRHNPEKMVTEVKASEVDHTDSCTCNSVSEKNL